MWLSILAIVPLVVHAWGAPLGEPVAEDFDFLHWALFSPRHSLLDGGASTAFWRPLAFQIYYWTLAPLILAHPGLLAALHAALLVLATALVYRAFRRVWPGPAAALVASFPLLSESTRSLISWPSHFGDLGAWVFTAIAIHEAAARRLVTAVAALLAALLCKEVAVVAALLIPWMPGSGPSDRRTRVLWTVTTGALVVAWAALYLWVRHHAGLVLPHHLETDAQILGTPFWSRFAWALGNSTKALFSLPAVPLPRAAWVGGLGLALALVAGACFVFAAPARARLRARLPWIAWGGCWFVGVATTLTAIYPLWGPYRTAYAAMGFGIACTALLGAAHPLLLAGLVGLRLAAFAPSPAPPTSISMTPPETGAFMDFERLVRLQRLMRGTREILMARFPRLPAGGAVGQAYMPWLAQYAFGGSRALQVWYRDSTLRWVSIDEFNQHPEIDLATIVEFESQASPQLSLVSPEAMRSLIRATRLQTSRQWGEAIATLDRADSLQDDPTAVSFHETVAVNRGVDLLQLDQIDAAEREILRALALWPTDPDAHYAFGLLRFRQNRLEDAKAEFAQVPDHEGVEELLAEIRRRESSP